MRLQPEDAYKIREFLAQQPGVRDGPPRAPAWVRLHLHHPGAKSNQTSFSLLDSQAGLCYGISMLKSLSEPMKGLLIQGKLPTPEKAS